MVWGIECHTLSTVAELNTVCSVLSVCFHHFNRVSARRPGLQKADWQRARNRMVNSVNDDSSVDTRLVLDSSA